MSGSPRTILVVLSALALVNTATAQLTRNVEVRASFDPPGKTLGLSVFQDAGTRNQAVLQSQSTKYSGGAILDQLDLDAALVTDMIHVVVKYEGPDDFERQQAYEANGSSYVYLLEDGGLLGPPIWIMETTTPESTATSTWDGSFSAPHGIAVGQGQLGVCDPGTGSATLWSLGAPTAPTLLRRWPPAAPTQIAWPEHMAINPLPAPSTPTVYVVFRDTSGVYRLLVASWGTGGPGSVLQGVANVPILYRENSQLKVCKLAHDCASTPDNNTLVITATNDTQTSALVLTYDVTNKQAPLLSATRDLGITPAHDDWVKVDGSVAHVSTYNGGYYGFDVTDPANPTEVYRYHDASDKLIAACPYTATDPTGQPVPGVALCYESQGLLALQLLPEAEVAPRGLAGVEGNDSSLLPSGAPASRIQCIYDDSILPAEASGLVNQLSVRLDGFAPTTTQHAYLTQVTLGSGGPDPHLTGPRYATNRPGTTTVVFATKAVSYPGAPPQTGGPSATWVPFMLDSPHALPAGQNLLVEIDVTATGTSSPAWRCDAQSYPSTTAMLTFGAACSTGTALTGSCGPPGGSLGFTYPTGQAPGRPGFWALTTGPRALGGMVHPFDLGLIGAPGCKLYLAPAFTAPAGLTDASGLLQVSVPLPALDDLQDAPVFVQAFVSCVGCNALGLLASERGQLRIPRYTLARSHTTTGAWPIPAVAQASADRALVLRFR